MKGKKKEEFIQAVEVEAVLNCHGDCDKCITRPLCGPKKEKTKEKESE
ncbi:MAG: hypothetical protein K8I29_19765 [Alphaproteobacteria bacterium]|uniref:Uncharacterized protein n=1 Tax=Candidatus Nitrobium versatile TaxID=2884831 RepID=A0A953SFE4_9BACT|nr:hypothetical protein [Candidatus Nitrobium versatile]